MRAFLSAAAVVAAAASLGFGQAGPAAPPPSIEGVWKGTSVIVSGANAVNSIPERQPNVVIFTKQYYSLITVAGSAPRPVLPAPKDAANLSDAEKIARYEHWEPMAATAGRYELKGTTLSQYALVGKTQTAAMLERNKTGTMGTVALTSEVTFPDSNTMVHTEKSLPGQPVSETRRTYTRLVMARTGATTSTPVEGVWQGTSTVLTGADPQSSPTRAPNIFIYIQGFFSTIRQDGGIPFPPRPVLSAPKDSSHLTDAEKLARYDHWAPVAINSGRYDLTGSKLSHYDLIARNQRPELTERNRSGVLGTPAPVIDLEFPDPNTMMQIDPTANGGRSVGRRTFKRLE